MNYEERYKDALAKARDVYQKTNVVQKGLLENLFPELAKNEDERIKQSIIADIKSKMNNCTHTLDDYYREQIAWLEKQGEQMSRKEVDLMRLYNRVLNTFGIENQTFMLVEECAELLNAVAKMKRGRANKEDIITELADVSIMVEQIAFFYGCDEFKEEKERKLARLEDRINRHIEKGGEE